MGAELLCLFIAIVLLSIFYLNPYDFGVDEQEDYI